MFPPSCMLGNPRIVLELYHEDGTRKDFVDSVAEEGYTQMRILDLLPGKYTAKAKVHWTQSYNREYTFRIYSPFAVEISDTVGTKSEKPFLINQVFNK